MSVAGGLVRRYLGRLRFPWLFVVTLAVFGVDLAVPDVIPFVDEVLLALTSLLLGSLRKRKDERTSLPEDPPGRD